MSRYISMFKNSFNATYAKLGKIPFVFILIAIAIYFWINGPAHFPTWGSSQNNVILIYIVMMAGFLVWSKTRNKEMYTPVSMSAFNFVFFFLITWVILIGLVYAGLIAPATDFDQSLFWPVIIMQLCVVAPAEELIFRGVIQEYTGIIIQAILFAVWHSYAYGFIYFQPEWESFKWTALVFAFFMGIILGLIVKNKKFGLESSIAVHACYNLVIMGVLTINMI